MSKLEEIDRWRKIRAFSHGPSPREPSDADLLGKALNPHADVVGHLVVRRDDGSIVAFKPGASRFCVREINDRVQKLLKHYEPTTQKDEEALRSALRRFGVDRVLPERKRERTP
ncbi:hypothetical protein [Methylobacterium sp. B4]|uniref:hypothetical protein n=1 Tax=Methylobacterium sp. B4 TaxID=1938755 RepID=UPI0011B6D259|nr:hypothetical protein [Methylobacterium sp. B4]